MSRTSDLSYAITTLGCAKNRADTREMERVLRRAGFRPESAESADLHIVNSCCFVEAAREETIETLFDAAAYRSESKPDQRLILVGCFSERYQKVVASELPEVDFALGTGRYSEIADLIIEYFQLTRPSSCQEEPRLIYHETFAPLKISEGCDRRCSFCAIPSFRGRFRSIDETDIIAEASRLSAEGVRELTLVSQDLNSYGGGSATALCDLIEKLSEIEPIAWIRLLYLYPDQRTFEILEEIGRRNLTSGKLVPYFESPLQHVSASVLKAMGRSGGDTFFRELFILARETMPECEIRTAFIIGFPGESEDQIEELADFLRDMEPEKLALFPYSPEEGTTALQLGAGVAQEEMGARISHLQEVYHSALRRIQLARVGRRYHCMVDNIGADTATLRRRQDAPEIDEIVEVSAGSVAAVGELCEVEISGFLYEYDMIAKVVKSQYRESL